MLYRIFYIVPTVETQCIRNLKIVLMDETGQSRVVTAYGLERAEKSTDCKMLANDNNVRQQFKDGIIWVELGETASSGALIEQLVHAVKRSGGERTAESIIHLMNAEKFDLKLLSKADQCLEFPSMPAWIRIFRHRWSGLAAKRNHHRIAR
jgi:hypothetical protein